MTMLERQDGDDGGSYLQLAEFISDNGAAGHVDEDLEQLFRRVVFNVLVGNRDDHLRNHGFIREPTGWRLSPAYDVNPNPNKQVHALTLDGVSGTPSIAVLLSTAALYRLDAAQAKDIVGSITETVSTWKVEAKRTGLSRTELKRMESVFQL
jgi:serine/threonine-protein kinase HipA